MKTRKYLWIIFTFLVMLSACTNNRRVVENPTSIDPKTNATDLEKMELSETTNSKAGFTENAVPKVLADKDVFPYIINKFKGKPILLDIWATWCGPCKKANEEMKPLKEELSGKDIVYVYVAGDNSPLQIWKNMIPDLHGEHFRLTANQWSYMIENFGIEGVPTYFFIDREGNIIEKVVGYYGVDKMKENLLKILD